MIDLILLRGLVLVLNLFFIYLGVFFIFYLWVVITLQIIKISACVATPLLLLIKFVFFLINSVQVLLLILSALIPNSQNLTHYHLFNLSFSLFILHRFFFLLLTFAPSWLIPHILNLWV